MASHQFGYSGAGMRSVALRDLDYINPRVPLRKTALPQELRKKLGLKDRNGGIAGKEFAPPIGSLPPIKSDGNKAQGYGAKGVAGMVSRATRVRLDPSHPDSKKGIGMSNVLKKAENYGSKQKNHAPTHYADPDVFGEPKRRRRRSERTGESDTEAEERRRERRERRERKERAQRQDHEELRSQAQSAPTHVDAGSYADKYRSRAEARRERETRREKEARAEQRRLRRQAQAEAEMREKENCDMNRSRQQPKRGFRDREEKPRAVSRPRGMRMKEEVEQPVLKNKKKKERKERKENGEPQVRPLPVDTNFNGGATETTAVDERLNLAVHIVSSAIKEDKEEAEAARRVVESLQEEEEEEVEAKEVTPLPTPKEENILKGGSDFFDAHFVVEEVESRRHDGAVNDN